MERHLLVHGVISGNSSFKKQFHVSLESQHDGSGAGKQQMKKKRKKKTENMKNMFLAWDQKANKGKDLMNVWSFTKLSALKRKYAIKGSSTSKKKYDVNISCCPSCSCPDFMKNGKVVYCKQIF